MKKFLSVLLAVLIAFSAMSVVCFADEIEPPVEEEKTIVEELFPNLKAIQWGSLLVTAAKTIADLGKNIDEIGFDFDAYKLAFSNALKEAMINGGYEEAWNIIQQGIEERMGKDWDDMKPSNAADIAQYIFDYIEHDTGLAINNLPNLLRAINAQAYIGKILNNMIEWISTPLTASTTLIGRIVTWFSETFVPYFQTLFGNVFNIIA